MILNIVDFDMNVAEASAAARIHHQWLPDTVFYESGISVDTLRLLREMGHQLNNKTSVLGSTQSIQRHIIKTPQLPVIKHHQRENIENPQLPVTKSILNGSADYRRAGSGVATQQQGVKD